MTKILTNDREFKFSPFKNEDDLEKVVVKNYDRIFGENSYYFDLKKGFRHRKSDLLTIPDGYLLRVDPEPHLSIVENELSTHDPVNHIGKHFLKYNSAFTPDTKYIVKSKLTEYLNENPNELKKVENLLKNTNYNNVSTLFDAVIMDRDFDFIIIIDEKTEELERVVKPYSPEIIILKKFENNNEVIYHIEGDEELENIQNISKVINKKHRMRKLPGIDTIVCPAKKEGFNEVFMGQHRWFAVRIRQKMIPKLKYLAMYEKHPTSAVRYIGKIKQPDGIRPYRDTGKYEIILEGNPERINTIKLSKENPNLAPQAPRYTMRKLIDNAKTLEDVFTAEL